MLMFSRGHGNGSGGGAVPEGQVATPMRNPRQRSHRHVSRSSYYERNSAAVAADAKCEYFGAGVREKIATSHHCGDASNSALGGGEPSNPGGGLFKRSSARSTTKKSRPHSWHSTLQRGFHRARSRSAGRSGDPGNHDNKKHQSCNRSKAGKKQKRKKRHTEFET